MAEKKNVIRRSDGAGGVEEIHVGAVVEHEGEPAQPSEGSLKNADKTSNPVNNDAEVHDPPVRTNRPDVPILTTLAVGAGAHEPTDDPDIDVHGRYNPRAAAKAAVKAEAANK